jgi:hypothetical protein
MGVSALGTTLWYSNDGSSWVQITEAKQISTPKLSPDFIDVSKLTDTAKQKVLGLVDSGSFSFKVNNIASQFALLSPLLFVSKHWQIRYVSGDKVTVDAGMLKTFDTDAGMSDALEIDCEVEVSGSVTYTPAA